jgi:uncharacterized protein YcbX
MALDRAGRLRVAVERDGPTCIWCGRGFTALVAPTTEHVVPRLKGGPSWLENEVAACRRCNSDRGHRGPVEWLEDCVQRGWRPDEPRLERSLARLAEAIDRLGGQRRARPYLDAQMRRLRRRAGAVGSVGDVTQTGQRVVGRLEAIWIYPVKSLAGVSLAAVEMDPAGPRGDRAKVVVDAGSGEPVPAKQAPVLATLAPSGDPTADERTVGAALGRRVRLEATTGGPGAGAAAVHLVSRQAIERARLGEVPDGCSSDDPRANLVLSLPADDERTWVGRRLSVGDVVLEVTRTPKHCLGVYAEVRDGGVVRVGDAILL